MSRPLATDSKGDLEMTRNDSVDALADRQPGEAPNNPYADIDVDDLPDWWREAVEEFEAHGLRPYRPPRFADDILKYYVVNTLERELDVKIEFIGIDVDADSNWIVRVDGETVAEVGHHRDPEGYSVFEIDSVNFASMIRGRVNS